MLVVYYYRENVFHLIIRLLGQFSGSMSFLVAFKNMIYEYQVLPVTPMYILLSKPNYLSSFEMEFQIQLA